MPLNRVGQTLLIEHKLPDTNTGVFVRGRLFDEFGAELAASPVSLGHLVDGLYRYVGVDIPMPSNDFVTLITKVFEDALFTDESCDYSNGSELFQNADDYVKTNVVVPRSDEIFIEFDTSEMVVYFENEDDILVEVSTIDLNVDFENIDEMNISFEDVELEVSLDC